MATASQVDFAATGTWQDIVATIAAVANAAVIIQNKGNGVVQVFFSAAAAPSDDEQGIFLGPLDSVQGTAAKVYVRASGGGDAVGVMLT